MKVHGSIKSINPWSFTGCSLYIVGVVFLTFASPAHLRSDDLQPSSDSLSTSVLKSLSLEELMNIEITIVSKSPESRFEAPAAVSVISGDEIRRSGVRSIPEALRLAPALIVARVDARQWAVSARGFNGTTANKLLVLIDGRSVYTPLYSGVFWDVQNVVLDDIDRIEVIRGPGGALWGANAVNGIINIVMKSSRETIERPLYVRAGAGMQEKLFGVLRYGGFIGSAATYRAYVQYFDRKATKLERGGDAFNAWSGVQGGFRTDYDLAANDELTIQGDVYQNKANQPTNDKIDMSGGNILARWNHTVSDHSELSAQTYFDNTHRRIPGIFGEDLGIFDLELQHRLTLSDIHELGWGFGFRHSNDRVVNSTALAFLPPNLQTRLYTGFAQDILTVSDELKITLGSKIERNDFSGFEFQPRVSFGWNRSNLEFIWASVSKAVRTPSRIDRDFFFPGNPPYQLAGGPGFKSEKVIAFEAGYRTQPLTDIFLDVALFYNIYDDLRSVEPGPPLLLQNGLEGKTYGSEVTVNAQITEWWRSKVAYCYLQKTIVMKPWSRDINMGSGEGNDPKHRLFIQSSMDVADPWQIELFLRYIGKLTAVSAPVPSYAVVDCKIGWNITQNLNISVLVQNVAGTPYTEFGAPQTRSEIGREVFTMVSCSL